MVRDILGSKEVLAGTYIPRDVYSHLGLTSVFEGVSRSVIIRQIIVDYLRDKDIDEMTDTLAKSVIESWANSRQKRKRTNALFMSYLEKTVRPQLERRHIDKEYVKIILDKAKELYAEDKEYA